MSRYGKYFLQHLLCLEDAFCHYYVQDDSWGRQEILDVAYAIFDWDEDAEAWLVQCADHDPYTTMNRLRTLLAEDCLTQYQVHRMNDRQVVLSAARELSMNAYRMVIEPKIGWAVRVDPVTDEPVQPIAVEAAPDMDDMLDELRVELDGLVEEQKKNYRQWEAKLAGMSDAEKAALYGKKAGGGLYNATIGSLVDLVKAAPGLAKKAASAWWKFKTYPLRLAQITAQAIKTGSMDPLQKEIKAKLGPVVRGAKQLRHFTSMTMVLLGEETTRGMLLDFVDRYWDNTHPLEKTELGAEAASEVVINILLAIFTAGVGVAANVAAKSGRLIKVARLLEKVAGVLKRIKSIDRLPDRRKAGASRRSVRKRGTGHKNKGPENPSPPEKKVAVDGGNNQGYSNTKKKETSGSLKAKPREFADKSEANSWGKKHYQGWVDDLSGSEKEAVTEYTGTSYKNINSVLRGVEPDYTGNNAEYAENLSKALKRAEVPEDVVVFRGAGKGALGDLKSLPKEEMVGKVIEDKGFMSTSMLKDSSFNGDVKMKINVTKGTKGAYLGDISYYPDEAELLLDKGQKMIITEASEDSIGRLILNCDLLP